MSDFACAWVTQALEEENVDKALVLGKSLRNVLTRKILAVIVRSSISSALRDALESVFDFVLCLEEGKYSKFLEMEMGPETMAKIFAVGFSFFKQCVYLPPDSLLLKNCDEIFDNDFVKQNGQKLGKNQRGGSVLRFQPSRKAFKSLTGFIMGKKNDEIRPCELDVMLTKWIHNQNKDSFMFLDEPYSTVIKLQGQHLLKNDDTLSIGHLVDLPANVDKLSLEENGLFSAGVLEKFIYGCWLDIYKNQVKIPMGVTKDEASEITSPHMSTNPSSREPVAIVGMSCRYPSSNNLAEFWNLLIEGRDGIRTPPDHRWTKEQSINYKPETRKTQAGFLNVPVDEFDAKFFGISPKEMIFIDPQHRILHELVWEALEDAGINPLGLNGTKAGVFMGSWRNDYFDILQRSSTKEFYRGYMGNSIGAGAARISHLLGLTGPCVATESGCSAAMVAAHMAVRSLQNGDSNMALACGVNLLLHPFTTDIMPMVTAPDGHCKSFDASADGFGRAEGCGVLVLKRLCDAVKDGDSIWSVIKGSAVTQEGISKSMGTPTVHCESEAMQSALQDAGVHPSQVSYVESHGTGTIVGDPMEIAAIRKVYGEERIEPLVIGSVKTNVGHTESCSGITGIMKVALSMKHEVIPPHRNFKYLNPDINLEVIPAQLPIEPVNWPKLDGNGNLRTAGVSSFGITGTDGHIILQDPLDYSNQRIVLKEFERPLHLMTISAKTDEALDILLDRYKTALSLENHPENSFPHMAYTANLGRAQFNFRAAIIATNAIDAAEVLGSNKLLKGEMASEDMSGKVCFLFTGQGSQYYGMTKELYTTSPVFQMYFDHCEEILKKRFKISIAMAFWGKDETLVNRTLFSQTGIFVVSYCLMKLWESWGVKPDYVLGHSLGEYCAAVCAGILTLEEALILVAERSRLIDALPGGKMLIIKTEKSVVDNLLQKFLANTKDQDFWLDFAAVNSSDQTVLAGNSENVVKFSEWLKENAIKCAVLQSSHAFHSRHMDPILEEYRAVAKIIFEGKDNIQLSCNYVSGVMGKILNVSNDPIDWPEYWVQHTRGKVNFLEASKAVYNEGGCRLFLEIGPHPVLTAFTMMNNDGNKMICLPSLRKNETDWRTMLTTVGKLFITGAVKINWKRFDQFYDRKKVGQLLPTYPFIGTKYWPNITCSTGVQIHPLLGSNIPNPTNAKIFQNNLSLQNVEYLKDHVIGSNVVFPGAGYIETLLMAGHVTLDGGSAQFRFRYPRRAIQLENFRIEAPLGLEEGTGCNCQTVVEYSNHVDKESVGGLHTKIYHEKADGEEGTSKWISHASASFSLYNPNDKDGSLEDGKVYLDVMNRLMSSGKEESVSFYDKIADVGLKFGPAFRTLSKVWRDDDKQEFLAQVKIPTDAGSYLLHPTLIDAMIQATVFHGENNKKINKKILRVPIACERFIWFKALVTETIQVENTEAVSDNVCYIYARADENTIALLDIDGNPIATLVKVEVIETNVKTIEALLETQTKSLPDMYKINWKSTLGPSQKSLDFGLFDDLLEVMKSEPQDQSNYSELQERREIDDLSFNCIMIAFLTLGWSPQLNDSIELDQFVKQLGIKQQHRMLTRMYLTYLEEENILIGSDDKCGERHWLLKQLPDNLEHYESVSQAITQKLILNDSVRDQVLLLQCFGENLAKILTGTESALRLLFPEDESKPSAAKHYDSTLKSLKDNESGIWNLVWENCRMKYERRGLPLPVVRILEVGAGTGALTETIISHLETHGMPYEYHYTDISAAFFPAAEKRFQKYIKKFKFRKLNLEQDPTSQGFAPKYYDLAIASFVVHATRDIKEAFLNLRLLLKDNAWLSLYEQLGPRRIADCTFGLLDGFWRFTDFELRPYHANMPQEKWLQVGKLTGYSETACFRYFELGQIMYRAKDGDASFDLLSKSFNSGMKQIQNESRVAWIIFYGGDDEEEYVLELKEKFEYIGRKTVILVKHSKQQDVNLSKLSSPLQSKYNIRPNVKADMDNLFNLLAQPTVKEDPKNGFSSIEGVLVTWGLCGSIKDQSQIALPFMNLIQRILQMEKKFMPQVVVLTAGQYAMGDALCENPSSSTLLGISKSVANEHVHIKIRGIDINPPELHSSLGEIFQEIFTNFNDEVAHFCAFRNGERFIPKMLPEKCHIKPSSLPLPSSTDRFQLIHPKSKSIQDLEFGDLELFKLKPNEIEVKVKCSALNFKDILNILKPIDEFKDSNGVGFDFAGVVTAVGEGVSQRKIGDAVFGINLMGNALPSHIKLPEDAAVPVPETCSFTEAACFPAVFSTAYYCLVNIAKVKAGETLLIHTASGGVGLLTIQLAKYFGLTIICTAGNQRKRAYLRSLGIHHVFHSRNTNYGKEIMGATNGRGVDIVLNSLTGPDFKEATLDACAKGARFVEMSKLNIWKPEEVADKRPDIEYTIVDLTKLDEPTSRRLLEDSRILLEDGVVKAIPYTRFDAQNIREALSYLQKAQHIGKVVVTMPELKPGQIELNHLYTPLYNERSTYLITGGLGGIGMEVCKYMLDQGAKNVVLVGRQPPNDQASETIKNLRRERNCNIVVMQADVGDWNQCEGVFQKIKNPWNKLPPLRGIMHCAGTLSDALTQNVKWENFTTTYQSKVNGSWNLHELAKDMILEHFVLFSSIVAPFGSPGQASHVSACTFEDTMAHYRICHGLPATTINWGQFGQVGIAAGADVLALRPLTTQQGINSLDLIIRQNRNYFLVASFDSALATTIKCFPYTKGVIDQQVLKSTGLKQVSKKSLQISSSQFWEEYNDSEDDRDSKVELIRTHTKTILRHVLRLDSDEPIDDNVDLQDLGVDSLMMLELKNLIQEILGDRVTITQSAMKDCNTINLLSHRLVQVIEEDGEFTPVEPPTPDQIKKMVLEDIKLPDDIQAQDPGSVMKPTEIKTLLMTGATGTLGSHMLRELLEECPQLEKVYCLVRTRRGQSAEEKLTVVLERKCVMGFMKNFGKVQCISGNFIEEKLGLSDADYHSLSNEVDAIVHCGAKVNHVEYYRKVVGGRNDARSVNVGGLLKLLEFAGTVRTKHVFDMSTLFTIHEVDETDGALHEGWPMEMVPPYNRGYLVSKYVCDFLLQEANERGIPCKTFKLPELRGSRLTGGSLMGSSHILKSFLFFMKEGIMPETPFPCNFIPVDLACRIVRSIMFNDEAPNDVYNVTHPHPQLAQEYFPKLSEEFGHSVTLVSFEEYTKRLVDSIGTEEKNRNKASLLGEFQELYKDESAFEVVFTGSAKSCTQFFEGSENFFKSKKLTKYVPDLYSQVESSYEIHRRDLLAAKNDGLLEKLGL